jgi:hypothetical protein
LYERLVETSREQETVALEAVREAFYPFTRAASHEAGILVKEKVSLAQKVERHSYQMNELVKWIGKMPEIWKGENL